MSYLTTPIYTRLLSTEEYGQTSVFLTWLQLLGIVAMFGLSSGVFNNGMIDFKENRTEFSFSMLGLSNLITIVFSVIFIFTYPITKRILGLDFPFVLLLCLIFLTQPAYNFWLARQRYELRYRATLICATVTAVVSPLFAVSFILLSNDGHLYARIFGGEIPLVIIYVFFYVYLGSKAGFKCNRKYWHYAISFNLPLIPHYLSMYLLSSSDRLMISNIIGDTETAYYSVAYSIASMALIVWSAINSTLIPYTYEKCKEAKYQDISRITNPLLLIFAVACVLVILMAPEVLSLMATSCYNEALYVIPPIVGGVFFQVLYFVFANIVFYHKKTKYIMYASVLATIINILLNFIFIPKFGYVAAGYTTLVSYMAQALFDYYAMKFVIKKDIYNTQKLILLSLVIVLISIFSGLLFKLIWIRYSLVLLIILTAFIIKKHIYVIFESMKGNA